MKTHRIVLSGLLCLALAGSVAPRQAAAEQVTGQRRGKKGVCITTVRQNADRWKQRVTMLQPSWHYSWGSQLPEAEPPGVEFVPMIWGHGKANEKFLKLIDALKAAKAAGTRTHLLGFNEPDNKKQAEHVSGEVPSRPGRTCRTTGLRLGGPAAVHADRPWMQDFMKQAKDNGYRVDFVCVHWYGGPNANGLIKHLEKIHAMYGKPIWITEFAVADWKAKSRATEPALAAAVLRFMQEVLPKLDALDFVERYAWFSPASGRPGVGAVGAVQGGRHVDRVGPVLRRPRPPGQDRPLSPERTARSTGATLPKPPPWPCSAWGRRCGWGVGPGDPCMAKIRRPDRRAREPWP
jgi:hypothetical protein